MLALSIALLLCDALNSLQLGYAGQIVSKPSNKALADWLFWFSLHNLAALLYGSPSTISPATGKPIVLHKYANFFKWIHILYEHHELNLHQTACFVMLSQNLKTCYYTFRRTCLYEQVSQQGYMNYYYSHYSPLKCYFKIYHVPQCSQLMHHNLRHNSEFVQMNFTRKHQSCIKLGGQPPSMQSISKASS